MRRIELADVKDAEWRTIRERRRGACREGFALPLHGADYILSLPFRASLAADPPLTIPLSEEERLHERIDPSDGTAGGGSRVR
jgi:hypothetical protein